MQYVHTLSCFGARGFPYTFLLFLLSLCSLPAAEFPEKPVKVIVPFGPGGGSDVLARIVQEAIRRENLSSQPFVIYNVPGAGGTLGSYRVKNARPDGYTILNLHDGILTAKHQGMVNYGAEAFEPIGTSGSSNTLVCAGPQYPVKNLTELLDLAANEPNTIRFGANLGAPSHFVGLLLENERQDANFRFVAAGGGSSRYSDLAGGHLDVSIFSLSEYLQFQSGGLKALGYLGPERHPSIPEIPTGKEMGVDLVTGTTQFWWAPKGTPADRVEKLADILEKALNSEWLKQEYARLSVEPDFHRGSELDEIVQNLDQQLAEVSIRGEIQAIPVVPVVLGAVIVSAVACFLIPAGSAGPSEGIRTKGWWIAGLVLAYALVLGFRIVPFWICTIVFAAGAGTLLAQSRRQSLIAIGTALALAATLQIVFQRVLLIDLP